MKTIPATSHEAVLVSKKLIAENAYEMIFSLETDFYFIPGQYIWLQLSQLLFDDPHGSQRAFSIGSAPQEKRTIRICFRASESGYKKTLLGLPGGSRVVIKGPFGGNFCLSEKVNNYVFIAGGTGISSFLSILLDRHTWENDRRVTLVYANKTKEGESYHEELATLCKQQKNFTLHEIYGPVSDLTILGRLGKDVPFYVSGPQGFVDAIYEMLKKKSILVALMHFEENYPRGMTSGQSKYLTSFDPAFMAKLILQETTNHIVFSCVDGLILYANSAAQKFTGYTLEEMRGNTPRLWGGLMGRDFYERLWQTIKIERKPFVDKVINRKKSGVLYTALARISPIIDDGGALIGFMSTQEDITELERINQAKTDFVSTASHQLRTPLSIMRWYSELLLGGDAGKPSKKQRECLNEILHGAQRMANLIDALLTVSRIELDTFTVEPEDTDVLALAKTIKGDFLHTIAEKKLTLSERSAKTLPHIQTDPRLLHVIYYNLLSNAVKYTPEGGTITVDIRAVEEGGDVNGKTIPQKSIVYIVSDTGFGIPESQKPMMYTKFFRADNARKNVPDGTGLGLYIVKSLVSYMHGMMWFESAENKGTTFFVAVPLTGTQAKEGTTVIS